MRDAFATALLKAAQQDPKIVVLSGDLGFMALEPLQKALGPRFINAGVAEQNMISVAAGLASQGFIPWVYSIAPFLTLRPYEQIRNDICFHRFPVRLVANGGGYGYGIMGATHHSLEDVGCMRMLPHMELFLPCYDSDVERAMSEMHPIAGPCYLRLNHALPGKAPAPFGGWRRLASGHRAVVISMGPVVRGVQEEIAELPPDTLEVVSVGRLPLPEVPAWLVDKIEETGSVLTVEEHVAAGGLGEALARALWNRLGKPVRLRTLSAERYPSGLYGSQRWHQEESGLAGPRLKATIAAFLGETP